jgi:ABC-type multidrug transport system ATPase subunit
MHLKIENLGKEYAGGLWGLRGFNLELGPGVLGLLGPNGAGKSTLMRMLATVSLPSEGSVSWDGVDTVKHPEALRPVLGYLPQDFGVYPNLNAVEFLEYMAAAKGLSRKQARSRIDELLLLVNLTDARKRPLGGFSGGMRQRVGIAQALLNNPQLLIVDEPTAGLDPGERVRFRDLLSELSTQRIIILSTHIVSDVEALAGHIALIKGGALRMHEEPEALLQRAEGQVWEWVVPPGDLADVRRRFAVSSALHKKDGVAVRVLAKEPPGAAARNVAPNLEDVYLQATWEPGAQRT